MRVLIAPNAFKSCLTATAVGALMSRGVFLYGRNHPGRQLLIDRRPLADGGDGTLDILLAQGWGELRKANVRNAQGRRVVARWLWRPVDRVAFIEMSEAAGLRRLNTAPNPWLSNTYGVGQLMGAALAYRPRQLLISLGGSATLDGGAGALAALGARFLDHDGDPVQPYPANWHQIKTLDLQNAFSRLENVDLVFLADVTTPLSACVRTFGPQKGVCDLDRFENVFRGWLKRLGAKSLMDVSSLGAAGGFAAPFNARARGQIQLGLPFMASKVDFAQGLQQADCVLTGEGTFDSSSSAGKVPGWVWQQAEAYGVRCCIVTGRVDGPIEPAIAAHLVQIQTPGESTADAMTNTPKRMPQLVAQWLGREFP